MFITCRRKYIDQFLFNLVPEMKGKVLDIGGKKKRKRGDFSPPNTVTSWEYLNSDRSTDPDFCCEASQIPVDAENFDTVLMCELLEHVENPIQVLQEAKRVLKPGGLLIITIPFLVAYHPDPTDYQRLTHDKIHNILDRNDFHKINISFQGSIISVIWDLFYTALCRSNKRGSKLNKLGFYIQKNLGYNIIKLDKKFGELGKYINTGYGITAIKK